MNEKMKMVFEDCLVTTGCSETVTTSDAFLLLLEKMEHEKLKALTNEQIRQAVSYRDDHAQRFQQALETKAN